MHFDSAGETQLIEAAREGDSRAFDVLVERYQEYLFRLMVRACHHPDDAEEVASDAFARAYEKLGQFEGRSSFVSWLGRIATNLCFRKREKAKFETVPDSEETLKRMPDAPGVLSPEGEALQNEMRRIIRAAVESLPEPDQTVLRLRDIDELSTEETAAKTGLTQPAVKSRLHRARQNLKAKLSADFGMGKQN